MIVYPTDSYESWISLLEAEDYFLTRLHAEEWDTNFPPDQEAALQMAFRSINELALDLTDLDSSDTDRQEALLSALKAAQCEQALHEKQNDLEAKTAQTVSLGGLLSVQFQPEDRPARYSERTLALLRPYLSIQTVRRVR